MSAVYRMGVPGLTVDLLLICNACGCPKSVKMLCSGEKLSSPTCDGRRSARKSSVVALWRFAEGCCIGQILGSAGS